MAEPGRLCGGTCRPRHGAIREIHDARDHAERFGQTSNNITLADNFGKQYQRYNGMLLNISARLAEGLQFQGGINTGKTVQDNCAVREQVPELTTAGGTNPTVNVGNPNCHSDPGCSPR